MFASIINIIKCDCIKGRGLEMAEHARYLIESERTCWRVQPESVDVRHISAPPQPSGRKQLPPTGIGGTLEVAQSE